MPVQTGRLSCVGEVGHGTGDAADAKSMSEGDRIEGSVNFGIVVEVYEHIPRNSLRRRPNALCGPWRFTFCPSADLMSPRLERLIGVSAHIQFFIAVQTHIDKIARDILEKGPFSRGVGDDEGNVVRAKQINEVTGDKRGVSDLDCMPDSTNAISFRPCSVLHDVVVLASERCSGDSSAGEELEEGFETIRIIRELRWKLP